MKPAPTPLAAALFLLCASTPLAQDRPLAARVDARAFDGGPGFRVHQQGDTLRLHWPTSATEQGSLALHLAPNRPLIAELGIGPAGGATRPVLRDLNPGVLLTIGERDPEHPGGWVAFFDNPGRRAYRTWVMQVERREVRALGGEHRATLVVDGVSAGSFRGRMEFTVFRGSPLVLAEAVVRTEEPWRAILYDAGLTASRPPWRGLAWHDPEGRLQREPIDLSRVAGPVQVGGRAMAAETEAGSVALFPPPHQYFYPLDFADNLGFAWYGSSNPAWLGGYGFGIQQPPAGDRRWVPWVNAPPGTEQRLGVFYLVSSGDGERALAEVARYTRGDRFEPLPGYRTFSSHYHIEHALELAGKRQAAGDPALIPDELRVPGFVTSFKRLGVDIVHLGEFHVGETPRLPAERRLPLLRTLHEECRRLSDDELLVLPGEEPNVHLGGHWLSFFPRPVYWILNRAAGEPFMETVPGYGKVYRVGSREDVLRLMEEENGLMWVAHGRIKGSRGYPDAYLDEPFFRSDRYLGAAWKAMPADLSWPRLGTRVLDLQDDLSNRGFRKHILGEVDIFRVEPEMELYAHMNVNYLKLDRVPRFDDGWQPVLDALRGGRFFVSTGEVLIPDFTVGGAESGAILKRSRNGRAELRARLQWTFPLAFAEVVSGDGTRVHRHRIDLTDTSPFGTRDLRLPLDLSGRTWVRLEVWDAARNGAFTPPVWVE